MKVGLSRQILLSSKHATVPHPKTHYRRPCRLQLEFLLQIYQAKTWRFLVSTFECEMAVHLWTTPETSLWSSILAGQAGSSEHLGVSQQPELPGDLLLWGLRQTEYCASEHTFPQKSNWYDTLFEKAHRTQLTQLFWFDSFATMQTMALVIVGPTKIR
jgi:hypothetical protein